MDVYYPEAEVYFSNPLGQGKGDVNTLIHVQNADLGIVKNVNRYDPVVGDTLTYTLDIANYGKHEATEVSIVDTLPRGVCYVAGSSTVTFPNWTL